MPRHSRRCGSYAFRQFNTKESLQKTPRAQPHRLEKKVTLKEEIEKLKYARFSNENKLVVAAMPRILSICAGNGISYRLV